jgi:hypothetical protein
MRHALLHLMLPFLLLAQVAVGMSPGRVICVALEACCGEHVHGEFDPLAHAHHSHAELHEMAHALGGQHSHGCPDDCEHACCTSDEPCDGDCSDGTCHIHIALSDDGGCTRDRSDDHVFDLRLMTRALALFSAECEVVVRPQAALPPPWSWPDCDRTLALETDCLVI